MDDKLKTKKHKKGIVIIMDQKEYTQADLETAKKITTIDGNVNGLTKDMEEVKKTMKEGFDRLNNSYESVKTLISEVFNMAKAHDSEIKAIKLEIQADRLKEEGDIVAMGVRVTALETANTTSSYQKKGVTSVWRNLLAVLGFIGLVAGTIITLITLYRQINGQ